MIDNKELSEVLEKLEILEETDEALAIKLLREFNAASKELGRLLLNRDESLSHDEWKEQSDAAKKNLDNILATIRNL